MGSKKIFLIILLFSSASNLIAQETYDTTIVSTGPYQLLEFEFGDPTMQFYEVTKTDIETTDGVIKKVDQKYDTIGVKCIGNNNEFAQYEIKLSNRAWVKFLFGRDCSYLGDEISSFPIISINRNLSNNEMSFSDPKVVSEFLLANYTKRISCIDSLEDKFKLKYVHRWIKDIEDGAINDFVNSLCLDLYHVFSLYDLTVPSIENDSIVCSIKVQNESNSMEFKYMTRKLLDKDTSTIYFYTDKVDETESVIKQAMKMIFEDDTQQDRFDSMMREDKSEIRINRDGKFEEYLRVIQSYSLDHEMKDEVDFYNYKISKIQLW